ncbi:MAG: hypothetical protein FWC49_04925 [Proteobacteria bacterium]|nr:hypothetical protein [Pseudomonadota bacterium]
MGEELVYAGKMLSARLLEQTGRHAAHAANNAGPLPGVAVQGFRACVTCSHNIFSFKIVRDLEKNLITGAPGSAPSGCRS